MSERLINPNDRRELLRELRELVLNHGATGPESPSIRARLRSYARVSWLAARLSWLETDDLLTSSGEMPRVDLDDTADLTRARMSVL